MFKNYLKIALRSLNRNKGYTLINILGLAIGLTCCLLILLYLRDELSYDRHHENADRIFRLTAGFPGAGKTWACIGPPVGPAAKETIPEIEEVCRVRFFEGQAVAFRYQDRHFVEENVLFADSSAFRVFSIPLLTGDPASALSQPHSLVLTQRMAQKYFGAEDPVGRTIVMNGNQPLQITAVLENLPAATHMPFDFLISMSTFYHYAGDWPDRAKTWSGFHTYLLLDKKENADVVTGKFPGFIKDFYAGSFKAPPNEVIGLALQPLTSIHLHSRLEKELHQNSDIAYIYIFSAVALLVLAIAGINFINLTTARATKRLREVGLRKVLGAHRSQLARQFLAESMLMTSLALLLTCLFLEICLPVFNQLTGKALTWANLQNTQILSVAVLGTLLTGLLSGSYPAFYISRFQPSQTLRGLLGGRTQPATLRKGLVMFQFAISAFLIVSTIIISNQLTFLNTKNLGFDKRDLIEVPLSEPTRQAIQQNLPAFKSDLKKSPLVVNVSAVSEIPGERFSLETLNVVGKPDSERQPRILWGSDEDLLPTLGLELTRGRNFSPKQFATDSTSFILNESAVREFGLEDPVGARLDWDGYTGDIVGVVKDFHFASLHKQIEPLVIPFRPYQTATLLVRVAEGRADEAIRYLEAKISGVSPNELFRYAFLDMSLERLYKAEHKLSDLFRYFSGLAILIACLGLFGLAAFSAEQRTKEIGVRKVLGASIANLVFGFSKESLKVVAVALIITCPVAFFAMQAWLRQFAYQTSIHALTFLIAGAATLAIAWLTVSFQAWKAAVKNPIETLRHE